MEEESCFARSVFSHLWQHENGRIDTSADVREKSDALRCCVAQLHYYKRNVGKNDDSIVSKKSSECLAEYGKLMDAQDGINNCADAILSLLGSSKNESKKWKTGLNANEIIKKYLAVKTDSSTMQEEDLRIFAHHVNTTEEKSPFPLKERGIPSPIIDEQHTAKQRFTDLECSYKQASFDLMGDDDEMFKENNTSYLKHQEARFPVQDWKQKSFGNDVGESNVNRGRGRTNGSSRGQYPWQRFNAASNTRGESQGRESFGSTNSNFSQGGSSNPDYGSVEKTCFRTASHQLVLDQQKKNQQGRMNSNLYGSSSRSLGVRRVVNTKFVPPVRRSEDEENFGGGEFGKRPSASNGSRRGDPNEDSPYAELMQDERLKNIDSKMVELIMNEIMDNGPPVNWDDIAGLELAKTTIQEIVVWPMLRPDIFTGLRGPPKGILLFGPPGTGKTMIGKCIACQSGSTFFSISASSLTSKWVGEGEKMVRAMFAVARCHQPAVIFIDEIDSLLTQRSDTEHESSRRIKTEFLVQLDGATSGSEERLLVVGATNRPQELDEAARRRLVKRLYIPLPEAKARQQIVYNLMGNQNHSLNEENIENICLKTDGYSGADMANLCREAALGPIRSISLSDIKHISVDEVRPISMEDFMSALCSIRASVSDKDLQMYEDWNHKFGISARLNS